MLIIRLAVGVERIPQRERHAEEALAGNQPVAVEAVDPVVVTHVHEVRVEVQLVAALDEFGVELLVGAAVLQIPLAGSDDFERLVALLVEVRHTSGGLRLAVHITGFTQVVDDDLAGGEGGFALGLLEDRTALRVLDPIRHAHDDAAVALDDRAGRQLQVTPPFDVGHIAEGAAHRDARALVHLRRRMRENRHLDLEQRRVDILAEILLIAIVVRVGDQRAARGEQFRTGGFDVNRRAIFETERDLVIEAGIFAAFQLSLGDCGLEGHVPQARSVLLIGLAAGEIAQEGFLGDALRMLADRVVGLRPIDRQAERTPQLLELLLVFLGETLAQFDEVLAADRHLVLRVDLLAVSAFERRLEIRIVLQGRVHAHAVIVLHAALGRQAVVVPTHRVEDVKALHALETGDDIGVRVGEHVADMQMPGHGGRRGVDRIDGLAVAGVAEFVDAGFIPRLAPLVFEPVDAHLVRQRGQVRGDGIVLISHNR